MIPLRTIQIPLGGVRRKLLRYILDGIVHKGCLRPSECLPSIAPTPGTVLQSKKVYELAAFNIHACSQET